LQASQWTEGSKGKKAERPEPEKYEAKGSSFALLLMDEEDQ
jgi:hypothetical protein